VAIRIDGWEDVGRSQGRNGPRQTEPARAGLPGTTGTGEKKVQAIESKLLSVDAGFGAGRRGEKKVFHATKSGKQEHKGLYAVMKQPGKGKRSCSSTNALSENGKHFAGGSLCRRAGRKMDRVQSSFYKQ